MMNGTEQRNDETQYLYYLIISQLYSDGYTQQANELEMLTLKSCEKVRAGNNLQTMLSACISSVFDVTSYFIENQTATHEDPVVAGSQKTSPSNDNSSSESAEESVARTLQSIEQHLLDTNKLLIPEDTVPTVDTTNDTLGTVSPDIEHLLGQLDSYMKSEPVNVKDEEMESFTNVDDSQTASSSDIDLILQGVQLGLENNLREAGIKSENNLNYGNYVKDVFAVDRQLKCSICGYLTYSKRALTIHQRSHAELLGSSVHGHSTRSNFKTRKEQDKMLWNKKHRPYPCVQCNYRASSRIQLTLHIRTHTGEKPNLCPYCDYRTAQKGNLNTHIKQRHGTVEPFKCGKCHFKSASQIQLTLHEAHVHKVKLEEPPAAAHVQELQTVQDNETKPVTENQSVEETLNEPNNIPEETPTLSREASPIITPVTNPSTPNKKQHQCLYCDYSTAWKGNLKAHVMNRHGGGAVDTKKTYYCKRCNFQASSSALMNKHFRTHSSVERPHKCTQCDYRAGLKSTLETHVKYKHTKERPFSCSVCDYRCVTKGQLQVHERRHTGERPFACPYCEFRTAQQSNLRSHVLHRHPEHQYDIAWKGTRGRPRKEFQADYINDENDFGDEEGFAGLELDDNEELPTQLVSKRKIS